ncbi:hypothetical protein BD560DRAFT_299177, partial [Blakeslea trispora]
LSLTAPLQGSTWTIGNQETVSWQNVQDNIGKVLINLMQGDPNALKLVQTLAQDVDASLGNTTVTVPENVTAGNDYALAVGTDPSQMAYIGGMAISSENNSTDSDVSAGTTASVDTGAVSEDSTTGAGAEDSTAGAEDSTTETGAAITSAAASAGAAASSAVGSAANSAASAAGTAAARPSASSPGNTSGAGRNLASGIALAVPAIAALVFA